MHASAGNHVILVHYRHPEYLTACLDALLTQTMRTEIHVVDNSGDYDGTIALARKYPSVSFLPLRRNVGFAQAVNIAAARIDEVQGALITLNPDTIPKSDFIEQIVTPLADPSIDAVAGTLTFASAPQTIASAGIRVFRNGVALDALLGEPLGASHAPQDVFGPSGGAAAYRLSAFRAVGGFCGAFFLYLEDVDLAWRMRLRGCRSVWTPSAVATHVYSAASGEGSRFKRRLLSRNRIWTIARCWPTELWERYRAEVAWFDLRAVGWATLHADFALPQGRAEALLKLPMRLCERRTIQATATSAASEIECWLEPSPSDRELLRLRRLTAELAGTPRQT